jgi:hypothetical protein
LVASERAMLDARSKLSDTHPNPFRAMFIALYPADKMGEAKRGQQSRAGSDTMSAVSRQAWYERDARDRQVFEVCDGCNDFMR